MTVGLITKSGGTLPVRAVSEGDLPTIKYVVKECNVHLKGECNSIFILVYKNTNVLGNNY